MNTNANRSSNRFLGKANPDNSIDLSYELQDQVLVSSNRCYDGNSIFNKKKSPLKQTSPLTKGRQDYYQPSSSSNKRIMENSPSVQIIKRSSRLSQELDFLKVKTVIKEFVIKKERWFCCCLKRKVKSPLIRTKPQRSSQLITKKDVAVKKGRTTMKQFAILEKLTHMSVEKRQNKAVRHLYDALYFRSPNNELDYLDNYTIKLVWRFVNSSTWNTFLWLMTLLYQLLAFFEPPNRMSDTSTMFEISTIMIIEIVFISFYLLDYLLILSYTIPLELRENGWKQVFYAMLKSKNITKFCFLLIFISDILNQIISRPAPTLKFSRIIRAFMLCTYSKDLRRNLQGILKSLKQLLILFLFYFIIIGVWAFIGSNIFGQSDLVDPDMTDYSDFFKLFNMLYMLSTLDYFPDIAIPYYYDSVLYLIYFIPYVLLFVFLFIPIPLAVVYEGFRQYRTEILVDDRIKQKTALLTCFMCLDINKQNYISEVQFTDFMRIVYNFQMEDKDLYELYDLIDTNRSGKISIDEFFTLCEVVEDESKFELDKFRPLQCWVQLRFQVNKKFNLILFLERTVYVIVLLIITLSNCTMIISSFFVDDPIVLKIFDTFDVIYLVIYSLEVFLKLLALGVEDYFDDDWNKFDFFLVVFQILFDYILFSLLSKTLTSSLKTNRVLKLAKIQKIFRLFRAFRTLKIVSFLAAGLQIFNDVKNLFYKIIICIPAVFKLISIVWIVFFIYATIGVEILSTDYEGKSDYEEYDCSTGGLNYQVGGCNYTSFDSFGGAYLQLLQTFLTAQWAQIVFDTAKKKGNLLEVSIFLGSFVFLSIFQLALIGGLVWEVFIIGRRLHIKIFLVDKSVQKEEEKSKQQDQINNGSQKMIMLGDSQSLISRENIQSIISNNSPLRKLRVKGGRKEAIIDLEKKSTNSSTLTNKDKKQQKTILMLRDESENINFQKSNKKAEANGSHPKANPNMMFKLVKNINLHRKNMMNSLISSSVSESQKFFPSHPKPTHKYVRQKYVPDQIEEVMASQKRIKRNKVQFLDPSPYKEGSINLDKDDVEDQILQIEYETLKIMYQVKFQSLHDYRIFKNIQMDEFIQSFINQIKDDLKNFDNNDEKIIQTKNHRTLIANAILKNANQEEIRQKEFNHFIKMFGSEFDKLREIKLTNLFALESRILFDLNAILKFSNVSTKYFFQILLCLELKIQQHLLKPGSFIKMLHQLSNGQWFQVFFEQNTFRFDFLEHGPWNFYNEILPSVVPQESHYKSGLPMTPYETIQQSLLIADDLDFDATQNVEKQEVHQFQKILVEISKQFTPLSLQTFEQDQFKFAMVEIANNNQEFLKQEFIRTYKFRMGDQKAQEDINTSEQQQTNEQDQAHQCTIQKTLIIALVKHTFNDYIDGDHEQRDINYTYLPFQYVLDLLVELGLLIQNHNINFFQKLQEIVHRNSVQ